MSLRSEFRYDFRIKTVFGSSLPPVVCMRAHAYFSNSQLSMPFLRGYFEKNELSKYALIFVFPLRKIYQ